ncbi:class D sortase [Planococcus halotolerans]|nr:class D sortase [Planococcus halotolerans]QHJ72365.1 class D sortase [Planococcus halotolerans]
MGKEKSFFISFLSILLIAAGLFMAASYSYQWARGYLAVEQIEVEEADASLMKDKAVAKPMQTPQYESPPETGEQFGKLTIPKLEVSIPIFEGTDPDQLAKGIGHFSNSVLPGEDNNSVLSGHRDTVFRRLGEVGEDDLLIVTTSAGEFTYRVQKVRIVDADDRTVIVPKPRATLTVTTCYPFNFIGNAPERYVLVAELIGTKLTEAKTT